MAAATCALRLSARPGIGIVIFSSHIAITSSLTPLASLPITQRQEVEKSISFIFFAEVSGEVAYVFIPIDFA